MNEPQLAIVIVHYRCWADLQQCLDSLRGLPAEIIVVDNHSDDGRMAKFADGNPGVRFLESDGNYGYAYGCNLGAASTTAPELLFLNPDAHDPGGSIAAALDLKQAHPRTLMTVRQLDEHGRVQRVFESFPGLITLFGPVRSLLRVLLPRRYPHPRNQSRNWLEVDWISGSVLFIDRMAFEELGGWSEDYWMYSEDVDLCRRARDLGMTVAFSGKATMVHRHGSASHAGPAVRALTRAETTISRHLYAHRHLGPVHAFFYHIALVLSRLLPPLLLSLLPLKAASGARLTLRYLLAYYRQLARRADWRSPRARH